jgi:hypothetical protein
MTSELEEALYWEGQAVDAHHSTLGDVRATASKWQAGISAFLGVYATVGFVVGPTTLSTWPVSGALRNVILVALSVAGLAAIFAVYSANRASEGIPKIIVDQPLTGRRLEHDTLALAIKAKGQLTRAMVLAGIAGLLIVGSSLTLLTEGVLTPNSAPKALVVSSGQTYCGSIQTVDGVVSLRFSNGKSMAVNGTPLTVVSSCGN